MFQMLQQKLKLVKMYLKKKFKAGSHLDIINGNRSNSMSKRSNSHPKFLFNKKLLNSKRSNSRFDFYLNKLLLKSKQLQ